jgi:HK97 family phage major capsid protein
MSMTVAEARSEIKNLFEQADLIEKKYPDGEITNNEDLAQVKKLLGEVDGLEAKLAVLEDAEARRNRIAAGIDRYNKPVPNALRPGALTEEYEEAKTISPGDQFIRSREYRELKNEGVFNSSLAHIQFAVSLKDGTSLIEWRKHMKYAEKTLLRGGSSTSGGPFVQNDLQPGYIDILQRELSVMDLIPRLQTGSDTVEYVRETAFTNNAAFTAEATATTGTTGTKPESALTYATATSAVKTLAHWIPVTNRMLADSPAIRGIINGRLLLGLDLILESQIVTGDGTGENFTGILNSGMNIQGLGTDSVLDCLFKARTQVRVTGKGRPQAYVLHPNDWQTIRLSRENVATGTLGNYLMGPPSQVGAVTVWGIPVVESEAITENTGLVGDFSMGCSLFDREQAAVRVGTIDDQFVRNMQTILAELRAAFVVWRPTMFTKITGI